MAKTKFNHSDSTILKHHNVYKDYMELRKNTKRDNPEIAEMVARTYFYNIICKKHNLTPNYVCTIICRIMSDEENFQKAVQRAIFNTSD